MRFEKVMVANRGEIAIRVFRACTDLGIRTVAIYSKEDKYSLFRTKADEAYLIGEHKGPLDAYLDIDLIIDRAKKKGVDAIHPGYGFLSENPEFARACEKASITFIGPPAHILKNMGDKINSKLIAQKVGVPVITGSATPIKNEEEALTIASHCGFPVILKASAGGGGRGMRVVFEQGELLKQFELAKSEARKAFGSEDIFIEKYLEKPKHIEVQILGDKYGNIVHLHERDCSIQRRHQKIIEFTPAFSLNPQKRQEICSDALKIAEEVQYVNAGTIEFLVDAQGNHYFIEMNPRIQVEHTITEMVTGIDLVQSQILIAQGYNLGDEEIGIKSQSDIQPRGYSIQCRITTEDARNNFAPDTGKITAYRSGGGFGIRLDAGNAFTGATISPYYDSLLVKVTTWDRKFPGAVKKALRAFSEMRIRGVKTNTPFLSNILSHPTFVAGNAHTGFIDETPQLFELESDKDRATKVLKYIGNIIVNENKTKPTYEQPALPAVIEGQPPRGLKQILDEQGPEELKKWILAQKKLLITDTTFRDAHQSLLATRVRTKDILTIAPATSFLASDLFSLEMWGGATFDVAYRFLHESPWTRLEELRKRIPNIPFQMLLRGSNGVGYTNYPDNVIRAFILESAAKGIDIFRIFDSLNWLKGMEVAIEEVLKTGKIAEGCICYTGDILDPNRDKYTLKYYIKLAKEIEKTGSHILGIKDMSGLLKPYAAKALIKALKEEISLPIHLHTHDTSGNQLATFLLAAEAGIDIVDAAINSLSGLTSAPPLNSLVAALANSPHDTGLNLDKLQLLSNYWEDVRPFYHQFETELKSPLTDIYKYEIPGGQYSNLKPQVESLGLGHHFDDVKEKYKEVNELLGDIVKVTPSSKVVGDLAIFMVKNHLSKDNIIEKGKDLTFPDSAVSYFKGLMGQPMGGFPPELQEVVLKGEKQVTDRPGALLEPVDFKQIFEILKNKCSHEFEMKDVLSYCLYPRVFEDYQKFLQEYDDLSRMTTHVFFEGLNPGETTEMTIEDGKTLLIKYVNLGEINEDGTRNVVFELNGIRREIAIPAKHIQENMVKIKMADPTDKGQVGSSIPGKVFKILVEKGEKVQENQGLIIIEAMKMETRIVARTSSVIDEILVKEEQEVKAGELLMILK
ncbi:MAG: pyruvate carboxylase [Clostridiaceae bacterium BRH_c20a]|nr:MAG: pyruvate carboxylase [Clostridiaceae bacterium BRH_c20a]